MQNLMNIHLSPNELGRVWNTQKIIINAVLMAVKKKINTF